ncbi:hypothetical protein KRR55_06220 [Paeniglutamicibacter sp. ABSL32-1]|uniref:hypothetical protein n=1 Tax=Paeniglutamicibacter quisquiliarum TaxID=2849498 RepID=UPI001C2DE104|nr:hypothetical protein [Paeniglutamicibacter quisquiliarum]MBV1778707.1 hypothetical protein [Paeniglutamicibacter quisquiliarum]
MKLGDLLNKTITVPTLDVPYYGPTLAERRKNFNNDFGFNLRDTHKQKPLKTVQAILDREAKEAPTDK